MNLTKKQRELGMKISSVIFIAVIIYALLSFLLQYNLSFNKFIASSDFVTVMILGIFSYLGYEILSGKRKFKIAKRPNTKTHRNTPRKKKPKHHTNTTRTKKKPARGTVRCPQCHHLIVGTYCSRCEVTWDEDELED